VLVASAAAISIPLFISPAANSVALDKAHPSTLKMASRTAIPLNTRLTTVALLSPSHGYGVFSVLGTVTCSDGVGLTNNGGSTFSTPVTVVSWPCAKSAPAGSLAFDDHGDGFFYGQKLFITHDGGVTWLPSSQPGSILSVEALGDSIWMLETSQPVSPSASSNSMVALRLVSSTNGGRTWTDLPIPQGAEVKPANAGGSGWLVRINQSSAYLASSPGIRSGVPAHTTPLWFTANAGATWSRRTIPCASFSPNMALSVAPDGTVFDVCAGEPSAGNQLKETVRSTNEGRSWRVRSMCHFSTTGGLHCTPRSQFSGYLGAIDAVSRSTVYLVGDRSTLMVSRDGGVTWKLVPPGLGSDAGGTTQVTFFSPAIGIVLGDSDQDNERPTLWNTSDSGAHWIARSPHYN
jgi:photosystem II stability/assembly factor-like uncharacterized protein